MSKHKFMMVVLGLAMIFSACAPKPKITPTVVPPPKPTVQTTPVEMPKVAPKPKEEVKTTGLEVSEKTKKGETRKEELLQEDDEDKYIVLNFEDAELEVVLQTISELIGMNYILGPKVKGKITIQTYKKIPREDLQEVLHSILAINGFTTVKSGHYYKIIPTNVAKSHPIDTKVGKDEALAPEDIMVTRIVPMEQIDANDLARIIKPLISKEGDIIVHKDTNLIIINELASNLRRLFKIIDLLDQPTELASGEQIFVYYVENADASKLANTLNSVYKQQKNDSKKAAAKTAAAKVIRQAKKTLSKRTRKKPAPKKTTTAVESELEGEMKIVADTEINALIVKTTPRDYKVLLELIKKLDIIPQQVLIEVLIANITLDNTTQFGLEWATSGGTSTHHLVGATGSSLGVGIPTSFTTSFSTHGLSYLIEKTGKLKAMVNLQVSKNNLDILSSPHLLTADNKEASINIVDQEPIQKTTYTGSQANPTVSWEYKDAGIKLKVNPKINDKGLVALKVDLEVSEVKSAGTQGNPSFTKRDVKTEVVVQNGQTLIIGGLIKEKHQLNKTGIPWLMDIPYLGFLFGTTQDVINKTELVLMLTPHVISDIQEAQKLSKSYQEDVDRMREKIRKQVK